MSDRLNELRRQRALVAEHLAWLDQKIKAETGEPPQPARKPKTASIPASARYESSISTPALHADPNAALEEWQDTSADPGLSKSGCWLLFIAIGLAGLGLLAAILYFVY